MNPFISRRCHTCSITTRAICLWYTPDAYITSWSVYKQPSLHSLNCEQGFRSGAETFFFLFCFQWLVSVQYFLPWIFPDQTGFRWTLDFKLTIMCSLELMGTKCNNACLLWFRCTLEEPQVVKIRPGLSKPTTVCFIIRSLFLRINFWITFFLESTWFTDLLDSLTALHLDWAVGHMYLFS